MVYWVWLVMTIGLNTPRIKELTECHPDLEELYYLLHEPNQKLVTERTRQRVIRTPLEHAQAVIDRCKQSGIEIMTWESENYPEVLRHIYAPPMVLFYQGNPELLQGDRLLTVVGTRYPSPYSLRVTDYLCDLLTQQGVTLVSGCAVGLDAVVHSAAVRNGTPTIGVLGCGIDCNYPRKNQALKKEMLKNGLLLTEFFPGTQPYSSNFPIRNRILSGISEAVLVTEAGKKSGCLVTANLACEQGKTVLCIPPADILDIRYEGQGGLLRDGACPVFGVEDILPVFREQAVIMEPAPVAKKTPRPEPAPSPVKEPSEPIPEENQKISAPPEATPEQQKILELLREGRKTSNMLCNVLNIRYDLLITLLVEMEMLGWIENLDGDVYTLIENTE